MRLTALVPMASVGDVTRSIAFYRRLGFEVGNTHAPEGVTEPVWAWLSSGGAQLMLAATNEPVDAPSRSVLFYLYTADVAGFRDTLLRQGVEAGEITRPFYNPEGEFKVVDPDGYVLMVTHT